MNRSALLIPLLLLVSAIFLFVIVTSGLASADYASLKGITETTTATFGTLLGIITAGLMFTQGKFGELTGELSEKSPDYLRNVLILQDTRSIAEDFLSLKKTFTTLTGSTEIPEEKNLYERIIQKCSSAFINVTVLLNLKLRQERLTGTGLLISEMSPEEHEEYQETLRSLKKGWNLFTLIKKVVDSWATAAVIPATKADLEPSLQTELTSSIALMKLKENVNKSPVKIHLEVEKTVRELGGKLDRIVTKLHEDRVPQLLTQMDQANIVRGRYFYLSLIFITAPLLVNLLILPEFSGGAIFLLRDIVALTSVLAILGVVILLFYIHKMLTV